ncbi:hypothetical protein ACOQFL_14585 [Actinopolyspora sp. H202]|uniref:hypothetical protein n=1 Tax=Actinopolyspora sp. H202 TaxID=1500456 RepID=UPI003EE43CA3
MLHGGVRVGGRSLLTTRWRWLLATRPLLRAWPLCGGILAGPPVAPLGRLLSGAGLRGSPGVRLWLTLWWSALWGRRWLLGGGAGR